MAYELNLTDDQYEAAYEVNLDYLMGINTYDDLYGVYWRQRNLDLSYILLDWQYRAFCDATRRDYFFFGRPHFYVSYRGDHCWRVNGGRSWYHGRAYGRPFAGGQPRMGMRDGFNRGDYGRGQSFGNMQRQSSTRTTVTRDRNFGNGSFNNGRIESNRNYNGGGTFGGGTFGSRNNSRSNMSRDFTPRSTTPNSSSFGGNRSFGGSNRSFNSGSNNRSNSRSFNSGSSNRSFGGGGTSRSFGGGGSHSNGGSKSGGGSFGGRR